MIRLLFVFFILIFSSLSFSQFLQTETVVQLEVEVTETSGLICLNDKIITHNDSGSDPKLYELDTLTGTVSRTVVVNNATNTDWEDVCIDANYIYIGDFGNNAGARTDLKIYRVSISDYNTTLNDTVTADVINFDFANQTSFTPSLYTTNFDVETLISVGDSLYVFTKNWGNSETSYYAISKLPGTYSVNPKGTINTQCMITGGVCNTLSDEILLCGYSFLQPFLIRISDFLEDDFENGLIERFYLSVGSSSIQIEGIYNFSSEGYYLTSESHLSGDSELLKITKANDLSVKSNQPERIVFYPNPVTDVLNVNSTEEVQIKLYNSFNQLVFVSSLKQVNVSHLSKGIYVLSVLEEGGKHTFHKIILE